MRIRYEGDLQPLIRWAVNRGQSKRDKISPPEPFRSWIEQQLPENCRDHFGFWVGVVTPDSKCDGDWVSPYPHRHVDSMGWKPETTTLLTYLIAPEDGGEFCLGTTEEDGTYQKIAVEPGLTISTDAATWHGVLAVKKGTRMALITTGFPA